MGKTLAELNVKIGASAKALNDTLSAAQKRLNKFSRTTGKLANSINQNITLPFVALGAVSLKNFDAQQKAIAKIETGLQSTGNAVGKTSKELQELAAQLQTKSLYGDEDILENVTSPLLTFVKIQGDVFDEAQQNVIDYASKLNIDLKSAALQVGKALNDPVKGINALARAGVQFSDEQKKLIKILVETGREADAQRIIMKELEIQFGGTAEAVSKTGLGPVQQLKNQLGDLSESIGAILLPYVQQLAQKVTDLAKWFTGLSAQTQQNIVKFTGLAAAMGVGLKVLSSVSGLASTMIGTYKALSKSQLLAAAAQKALNLVMSMNPLGLVISAIGLLVGGLVVAYNKSERFRAVMNGIGAMAKEVFTVIKEAVGGFIDGFKALADGDFKAALKGFKDGIVKANPLKLAMSEGNRLGEAFRKGYADTLSKPDALEPPADIQIPVVKVPVVPDYSGMSSGAGQAGTDVSSVSSVSSDDPAAGIARSVGSVAELSAAMGELTVQSENMGTALSKIPEYMPDTEQLSDLGQAVLGLAGTFKQMAVSSGASFGKMANAALSASQKFVKAKIYEGVSSTVSSALASFPFPINLAMGAGAGLAATTLFSKAMSAISIPAFEKGGAYQGGLALVGEAGPELINFNKGGHVTNNDDLMSMLSPQRGGEMQVKFGEVRFDGRDLVLGYEAGLNLLGRARG